MKYIVIIHIFQMRKLRHREVKLSVQGHTNMCQIQALNPESLAPHRVLLTITINRLLGHPTGLTTSGWLRDRLPHQNEKRARQSSTS